MKADIYGIDRRLAEQAHHSEAAARGSGRSTKLIQEARTGDRIIFTHRAEAQRIKQLCEDAGKMVEIVVTSPRSPEQIYPRHGRAEGRTLFDHSWLQQYYMHAMERANAYIDELHAMTSSHNAITVDDQYARTRFIHSKEHTMEQLRVAMRAIDKEEITSCKR